MNNKNNIQLTKQQDQCVKFKPTGSLLVRGIPGSGKSTIIMARAQYLKKNYPDESLLIITFSKTLSSYMKQLSIAYEDESIEASTFHFWAQNLLRKSNYPNTRLILGKKRQEAVNFAKNIIKKDNPETSFPTLKVKRNEHQALTKFLADEIEWIKGSEIKSREEYLNIKRSGRGTEVRITQEHRHSIYNVLEKYNELLATNRIYQGIDSEDLAHLLVERQNSFSPEILPDHILVDEAQDLHSIQLKAIKAMVKKSLTIGADKGQQIYRRTFTWKKAGIEVTGNRSRFLKETFRSTKQIVQLANHFQEKDDLFIKDEDYIKAAEPEVEGKVPEVYLCENGKTEKEEILTQVKKIRGSVPEDTIGIIANSKKELKNLYTLLEKEGIPVNNLHSEESDMISPGAKLITFHSSKGLEFDHVIVTGLKKGKLPREAYDPGEEEEEFLSRERKKFYVAMTRARKTLMITAPAPCSPFILDLNQQMYRSKKR